MVLSFSVPRVSSLRAPAALRGLAALALCGCAAGGASARAEEAGALKLYGVADAGVSVTQVKGAGQGAGQGTRSGLLGGGLSDNLWGLTGTEALGNGARVSFGVESGFDLVNGQSNESGRLFDYGAWVGIGRDGLGTLSLGRQKTVAMNFGSALEVASWRDMGMGALFRASDNYRRDHLINLYSADLGGWQAGLGHAFDTEGPDGPAPAGRGHAWSAGLKYEAQPWLFAATWDRLSLPAGSPAAGAAPTAWQVGVAADLEAVRVSLAWSRQRNGFVGQNGGGVDGLGPLAFVRGGSADTWLVGAEFKLDPRNSVLAQGSMATPDWHWDDGSRAARVRLVTLGYRHLLSPRTALYAYAGRLWRGTLDAPFAQDAGRTPRYVVGMNHTF